MTTQQDRAGQVPLYEQLLSVPKDARLVVDEGPYSTRYIPIGRMCREAAALLAADARGGEAVAWGRRNRYDNAITDCISPAEHARVAGDYTIPLYTHHQPERVPLTDEQITKHFQECVGTGSLLSFADGVRFAEAAHHIGKPEPVGPLEDCHGLVAGKETS